MKKVRLGLIGMGKIRKLHTETMSRTTELEFVAASDIDVKHQKTAEGLGTKFYQSYEEMIGKEWVPAIPSPRGPMRWLMDIFGFLSIFHGRPLGGGEAALLVDSF